MARIIAAEACEKINRSESNTCSLPQIRLLDLGKFGLWETATAAVA